MYKICDNIEFDEDMIIIVPSYKEVYYKKKYINNNYKFTTFKNYLLDNYNGNKKIVGNHENYIMMYNALKSVSSTLKNYKDFTSYSFVNDLLNTYDDFYTYDLNYNDKINDLNVIYKKYESLLEENNLINERLLKLYMLNNYSFNEKIVFCDLEKFDIYDLKIINKMQDVIIKSLNNKFLSDKFNFKYNDIEYNNSYLYNEFNDIEDELSFVLNDIKKRVLNEKIKFNDFAIVSPSIETYEPYLDLIFDVPYNKKAKSGLLTNKFIRTLKEVLCTSFSFKNVINMLKLDLFCINYDLVNKLDNYMYSWNLEDNEFVSGFNYNPNGDMKSFTTKDINDLNMINDAIESINTPIMYLLKNTINVTDKSTLLRELYTYLDEEKIMDKLYEKDYEGATSLVNALESINDYLEDETSLVEIIEILSNLTFLSNNKMVFANSVRVSNINDFIPEDKKYVYLVGTSDDNIETNFKASSLISYDDIKELNLIELINDYNNLNEYYLNKCLLAKNVFISYHKLSVDLRLKNLSSKIEKLNLVKYDNDKLYDVNLLKKDYALNLSANKINLVDGYFFDKINLAYNHDLKRQISLDSIDKLYNGNLNISPSGIEVYSKCQFSYFLQYMLRLNIKEKYSFDNRKVGTFVHYILENIVRNDLDNIDKDNIYEYVKKYQKSFLEENDLIVDNVTLYVMDELSKSTCMVIKNIIDEQKISPFKPLYTELKIKENEMIKPVEIKLNSGLLSLSGIVDRLDYYEDDNNYYYRIIDYKTGEKTFRLDEVINGLNLQMLLYLLAIKENKKRLTDKNISPSALLYYPALLKYETSSRFINLEEKEKKIKERLRMNGILNKNILDNIDEDEASIYYKIKSSNKICPEYFYDEDSLELIFRNLKETLKKVGDDILSGNININPIGKKVDSCKYCKFSSICAFDFKNDKKRYLKSLKNSEVLKMLEGDKDA